MGRRERLREQAIRDIKAAALGHLREHGAAELSLRAVARDAGMSAPGLYRYYDGRDDLLTALIADGYHDLADHLAVAAGHDPAALSGIDRRPPEVPERAAGDADVGERLRAACRAYRRWALDHPNEFGLIYGDPIPGYAAPEEGETVVASRRLGLVLGGLVLEAWREARLRVPPELRRPGLTGLTERLRVDMEAADVAPEAFPAMLILWSRLHGMVSMETFGHLHWLFPDGADALFEAELDLLFGEFGIHGT